ncbi:MAG TPA: DegV family protein, partial [Thermoleophilaceae bacterium]|nr:DegV family protein [Thermoleophilaceae bacterium]
MRLSSETTAVVVDSTADLPNPAERHPNWRLVPLYVRFGDETFRDHVDLSAEEFYRRLRAAAAQPATSQPTPADFAGTFEELGSYERVLCILISGKLSGTVESARLAAQEAGNRVRVIDSRSVSGGAVILADAIQRRLERGTTDEELDELVERFHRESGLLFTVDTLDYLVRGGRVGKAAGLAGSLLSVKPILSIRDGEVEPLKRVRGRSKALTELERLFVEATEDAPTLHVGVAHADTRDEADDLSGRVRRARPQASFDFDAMLGPVIGTHGGPGTLGLFWFS